MAQYQIPQPQLPDQTAMGAVNRMPLATSWLTGANDQFTDNLRHTLKNKLLGSLPGRKGMTPDEAMAKFGVRGRSGGRVGAARVDDGPIWSDQQIQERANLTRAQIGAETQGAIQDTYQNLGRQGFATMRSPLAMSMANMQNARGMMAGAQAENDLRWNAAEGNAQHVLQAQTTNADAAMRAAGLNAQLAAQDTQARGAAMDWWSRNRNDERQNRMGIMQMLMGLGEMDPYRARGSSAMSDAPAPRVGPDSGFYMAAKNMGLI